MEHQVVLVVDFGGQYNQLIVRRVRNLNVYAVMISSDTSIEKIKSYDPKGIIFTGGPSNVNDADAPKVNPEIFNLGVPVLGICYGMQLTAFMLGGNVIKADMREYGKREITYSDHVLFEGIPKQNFCCRFSALTSRIPQNHNCIKFLCCIAHINITSCHQTKNHRFSGTSHCFH